MRTNLTLDADVAAILKRLARTRGVLFKDLVNETLRRALCSEAFPQAARKPFRTRAVDLGRCLVGNVDDVVGSGDGATGRW